MAIRWYVCISALAALLVTGCAVVGTCDNGPYSGPGAYPPEPEPVHSVGCYETRQSLNLDRGDWAVAQRTKVWKVLEYPAGELPNHIGYVTGRRFRQMRGGPGYDLYTVTTLNRSEEVGRIDQMGRAYRYEPRRNAGFAEVDLGSNSMENDVAEILQTTWEVTLEPTNDRRLAFELLDLDSNGFLEAAELKNHGDRIPRTDTNGDGRIDFQEFDRADIL